MKDVSQLPHDQRLMQDPQYRNAWEANLVDMHNPRRLEDVFDWHDRLWFRAEIIKAGDSKTADMLLAVSREIARLEAENATLRAKLTVAVAAMAANRPLPEGGTE